MAFYGSLVTSDQVLSCARAADHPFHIASINACLGALAWPQALAWSQQVAQNEEFRGNLWKIHMSKTMHQVIAVAVFMWLRRGSGCSGTSCVTSDRHHTSSLCAHSGWRAPTPSRFLKKQCFLETRPRRVNIWMSHSAPWPKLRGRPAV